MEDKKTKDEMDVKGAKDGKHAKRQVNNRRYAAAGGILLAVVAVLQLCARANSSFATWYAHGVYPALVGTIGRISDIFPISAVEILLYMLIVGGLAYIIRFIRAPWRLLSRTVFLCGLLLFLFTINCGINYSAMAYSEYVGIVPGQYSKEELTALCEELVERINETATDESYAGHEAEWRAESVKAMQQAALRTPDVNMAGGETYGSTGSAAHGAVGDDWETGSLAGYYPKPKPVTISWILSIQQLCGVYSPFTIEANYNRSMPNYNIPHSMCHELSHLKGFMREDEANFIGYLACISSEYQAFQYSGYLTGWVYAGNALARTDMEKFMELYNRLCDQARMDMHNNNIFWDRYEGKVAEVSNQMNDTYLKINRQTDGVQSYGRMVDLMLAWRKMEGAE